MPRPKARCWRRTASMRRIQLRSEWEIAALRLDIHRLIAVKRVHDRRQHQRGRIGARKPAIAIRRPLHRRAHAVAVAEMDIVAHADLVAVIDDRRSRHRQQQAVHQLDAAPVALHQRRQPAADPEIEPGAAVGRIGLPQKVALDVGDHFQREFVMIAQEDRPLAVFRDRRRLAHDVGDRKAVLAPDRHVHARHQRKMERHVAFVAVAEIILGVFRPLVGLGEQHAARKRASRAARIRRRIACVSGRFSLLVPSRSIR